MQHSQSVRAREFINLQRIPPTPIDSDRSYAANARAQAPPAQRGAIYQPAPQPHSSLASRPTQPAPTYSAVEIGVYAESGVVVESEEVWMESSEKEDVEETELEVEAWVSCWGWVGCLLFRNGRQERTTEEGVEIDGGERQCCAQTHADIHYVDKSNVTWLF
ncbi:hypothetical protein B0H17DRAFT_1138995 [Mycena rosella]|uniref:Uncharacterized protein n=1 Tax=Mycena rosella TaxID=1033263 RepID=A0AAD7D5U5_MYCRO|nr:hypothetical protein B0H17DRAFT_1138995 [Mycena rosella]